MKCPHTIARSLLFLACSFPFVELSASESLPYQPFQGKTQFSCAGMKLALSTFTVDMDDVPLSTGKANMFYKTDLDMQVVPTFINGEIKDKNFSGGVAVKIVFGKGKQRRYLPQRPVYIRQTGYSIGNSPLGYDGGLQRFDSVLNPESKTFDIYYDVRCVSNVGGRDHHRFKTVGRIYKWPK